MNEPNNIHEGANVDSPSSLGVSDASFHVFKTGMEAWVREYPF